MDSDIPADLPADPPADPPADLPFVDEHRVLAAAPADAVWDALTERFGGISGRGAEAYASLVGAVPARASGGPLRTGSTLPGFEVTEAVAGVRLELAGRHRFSRYRLLLTLAPRTGGTVLSARTRAAFPGPLGFAYRTLVIGSGAHGAIVRRLLGGVARRAEERRAP